MKKIENLLVLPMLLLLVWAIFSKGATLDFHIYDTYYVVDSAWLALQMLIVVLLFFVLYKLVRRRHQRVSRTWVITHFSVSTALILITWFSVGMFNKRSKGLVDYSEAFNHRLPAWELAIGMAVLSFLVLQLTVFAYLIIRLIRPAKTP